MKKKAGPGLPVAFLLLSPRILLPDLIIRFLSFFGSETRFRRITSGPKKLPQTVAYLFQNHNKMAPPIVGLKQIM